MGYENETCPKVNLKKSSFRSARLLLEECRMVLPGIQALFGFQLVAVFNEGFSDKLTPGEQELHLAAIISTVVAIAAIIAPAALHRQLEAFSVSHRFIVWLRGYSC
jgi:hypothetical protein